MKLISKALREINTKRILIYLFSSFIVYIIIITFFAFLYYATDSITTTNNSLNNNSVVTEDNELKFFDAFYFSYVSFHTIGYGDYHPKNYQGKQILLFESIVSLFFISIFSGLLVYFLLKKPQNLFMSKDIFISIKDYKCYLTCNIGNKGNVLVNFKTIIEGIILKNRGRIIFYKKEKIIGVMESVWHFSVLLSGENDKRMLDYLKNAIFNNFYMEIRVISYGIDISTGEQVILYHYYKPEDIKFGVKFKGVNDRDDYGNIIKTNWNNFNIIEDLNNPYIIEKFKSYE